jgi:hypothetical protein
MHPSIAPPPPPPPPFGRGGDLQELKLHLTLKCCKHQSPPSPALPPRGGGEGRGRRRGEGEEERGGGGRGGGRAAGHDRCITSVVRICGHLYDTWISVTMHMGTFTLPLME